MEFNLDAKDLIIYISKNHSMGGGEMKTEKEIRKVIDSLPDNTKFFAMTYEQGIDEALSWVLDEISDEEFEYAQP